MSLAEDEIAYRGSVGDVNPSIKSQACSRAFQVHSQAGMILVLPMLWKFRTQTHIRFTWFGNLPTPRSYWLVLINQGNNTNKEEEKTLLNSTLHTQALSTALSRYPSLCSLCVLHTHTRSSSLSIYVYKWEWRGINHAMIYATVYVLHHVQSGRLGIPTCIWWDIVCLHLLTPHTYMNILDSP
jgi:hypothetical protein